MKNIPIYIYIYIHIYGWSEKERGIRQIDTSDKNEYRFE